MDAIVGRLYLIGLLYFSAALYGNSGSLALQLADMAHNEIKEVAIGQPFMLKVILKGDATSQGEPVVKNLNAIYGQRLGYQMNSINGNATVTYTYKARLDYEGTYVVGPVVVGNYQSDPLTITVGKNIQLVKKKSAKKQKALLQFFVDAHDVVVNEKIVCRLRFLFNDPAVSLKHIGQQEIPGFTQSAIEGPVYGTEDIKGKLFNYAEWRWTLSPQEGGHHIIPAYYADYFIKKNQHSFWGSFAHLLDDHDVKRIYSNAEKITVNTFDDAPYPVCAVGKNITIKASVDSLVVKQSEGMVLRLDITGDPDSSFMNIQKLLDMPEELKWYRSNAVKLGHNSERTEFIIQGLKSGDYEIPAQKFCYFDRDMRRYVAVETEPLIISITPLPEPSQEAFAGARAPRIDKELKEKKETDSQLPLSKSSWKAVEKIKALPWWMVILILLITGMISMVSLLTDLFKKLFYGSKEQQSYKSAFRDSLYAIKNAQREQNPKKLYGIFMHLLSIRCAIPLEQISLDRIEYELDNRGVDEALRARIQQFLNQLEEAVFGANAKVDDQLFALSIEWIDILKKIV